MRLLNSISENLTPFEKKAIIFILVSFLIGSIIGLFEIGKRETAVKVNLNTATIEELAAIPGMGRKTAEKIVNFRNEKGKIESVEEIKDVVGEKRFQKIKKYLAVEGQD